MSSPVDGRMYHVAIVTADREAAIERYAGLLGIGPFGRLDANYTALYRGETVQVSNKVAFARWGDIWLEILAPVAGSSGTGAEWLRTHGEGVYHVGYATTNPSQRPGGARAIMETVDILTDDGGPAIVHLDTIESLGYIVELVHQPVVDKLMAWLAEELA